MKKKTKNADCFMFIKKANLFSNRPILRFSFIFNKLKNSAMSTKVTLIMILEQYLWAITKLKTRVGWTIDKFRLNNSLAINGIILRFAYQKIDVQRRTFSNFGDFCCSYYQIIAAWILASEGWDKKGGFEKTNSSKYSISKSKTQGIFKPGFATLWIKWQSKPKIICIIFSPIS